MRSFFKLAIYFSLGLFFLALGLYYGNLDEVVQFIQEVSKGANFPSF